MASEHPKNIIVYCYYNNGLAPLSRSCSPGDEHLEIHAGSAPCQRQEEEQKGKNGETAGISELPKQRERRPDAICSSDRSPLALSETRRLASAS